MSKKYDIPKKKHHKGLIIFLIIFGILVVLPVGFVFGAFFTTKTKEVSNTTIHYENIVSESLHNGIKKLDKDNPQLDFTIDEDMIDGIMMAACEKINQPNYIPKMYCYINDNDYTFYADLQAYFFKTRVSISTKLFTEVVDDEKQLTFKINNITVGRLPIPIDWVTGILGNFLNDETLNNAFGQSGFHITSDLKNAQLIYKRETFKEDVGTYLSNLGSDNPFLNVLLNVFGDEKILTTNFSNGVTATFDLKALQMLTDDKTYKHKDAPLEFSALDTYKDEITKLLNYYDLAEADVPKIYTYLLRGYENSPGSEDSPSTVKGFIKGLTGKPKEGLLKVIDPTSQTDLTDYKGSKCAEDEMNEKITFKDYCVDTINWTEIIALNPTPIPLDPSYTPQSVTFSLPSDELNRIIAGKLESVIGNTTPITFMEDNLWYCDYVTVDNVYTGFRDSGNELEDPSTRYQFNLYLRLNISGAPVTVIIITDNIGLEGTSSSIESSTLGYLKFKIKDIYFGSLKLEDSELKNYILKLIPDTGVFSYKNDQFEVSIDNLIDDGSIPEGVIPIIAAAIKNFHGTKTFSWKEKDDNRTDVLSIEYVLLN